MTGYICIAMLEDPPYNIILATTTGEPKDWCAQLLLPSHLLYFEAFKNHDHIFNQFIQHLKTDGINVKTNKAFPAKPYEVMRLLNQIRDVDFNNQSAIKLAAQKHIGKFIVQDGIAEDTESGLMWLRFAHGQAWHNGCVVTYAEKVNWNKAIEITEQFNLQGGYAGYNDWRLPTIDELKSLVDKVKGKSGNFIDMDVFPKNARWFWTSSASTSGLRIMYFNYGSSGVENKDGNNAVRLVREKIIDTVIGN